jgi:hypothetical protein
MMPQRLVVPLFQRPYVWNKENQWEPLWDDVVRVAERKLAKPADRHHPHFLGAVVLQQVPNPVGLMQQRTIIDGQQRLTTLQLLLDALHAELVAANATQPALRIEQLVTNAPAFCSKGEDRFKVWPTNRDRPAFNDVMGATPPVNHDALSQKGEKMVEAHRFFSEGARKWLTAGGPAQIDDRASAIDATVRELLQMVVIDLAVDENAQEIFETLNARGAQLTAADLIKNFVFQRLSESTADVESVYQKHWKDFETGFWEAEVSVGRVRIPRSSLFLNHWLVARTGKEVVAREVFSKFKTFAGDSGVPMTTLVESVHSASSLYRDFVTRASANASAIDRLGLFVYRTGVLESEVVKPLLLCILDPEEPPVAAVQFDEALDAVESWMVRRMLVRATTKNYNQVMSELIALLKGAGRQQAGDAVSAFLAGQRSDSRYWPDDEEVQNELRDLLAYRRLGRGRLRMVLEAIEDHMRGWKNGASRLGTERVTRGKLAIEHIMPRKWAAHWRKPAGPDGEAARDRLIHTLGNLTLLNGRLNSKVSNGPWLGKKGKRAGLNEHDAFFLNRALLSDAGDDWTEDAIRARTEALSRLVVQIWPVPPGHRSDFAREKTRTRHKVGLDDLITAGLLEPGLTLFPRRKKYVHHVATLLADGQVDVDGTVYATPSAAAAVITGKSTNGKAFFLVDQASRRSIRDVWRDYVESLSDDVEESDDEDEEEEA